MLNNVIRSEKSKTGIPFEEKEYIIVHGGCTNCPQHFGSYDVLYVSRDSILSIEPLNYTEDSYSCKQMCDMTKVHIAYLVKIRLTEYTTVFKEHYFQFSNGHWSGKRIRLYGKYRPEQEILNTRKIVEERIELNAI